MKKDNSELEKYFRWYALLNAWIYVKNNKTISFENFFVDRGCNHIAIYGCGELGCRLFEELKNTSVRVLYMIDRNAVNIRYKCEIISITDFINREERADAVVVTPIHDYEEIKQDLMAKISTEIFSLEEVINFYVS